MTPKEKKALLKFKFKSTVCLPGKPDSRRERKQLVLLYYNGVQLDLHGANSIYLGGELY